MAELSATVRRALEQDGAQAVRDLARAGRGPIIEPTADPHLFQVTFVLADRHRRMSSAGLFCPAVPDGFALLAALGEATFAATFTLPRGARVRYHFCPDPPDRPRPDQLEALAHSPTVRRIDYFNPRLDQVRLPGPRLRILASLLLLPGAAEPPAAPPAGAARGSVEQLSLAAPGLRQPRPVLLYRPPGHAATGPALPLVVLVETAGEWNGSEIFDAVGAAGCPRPFLGVLIGAGRHYTASLRDLADAGDGGALARFVVAEVLPAVSARCRIWPAAAIAAGFSAGGLAAAALCAHAPQQFSRLAAISTSWHLTQEMDVTGQRVPASYGPPGRPTSLVQRYGQLAAPPRYAYLAAGVYEDTPRAAIYSDTAALAELLRRRGGQVRFDSGPTDHDSGSAQAYLAKGLSWLLQPNETELMSTSD